MTPWSSRTVRHVVTGQQGSESLTRSLDQPLARHKSGGIRAFPVKKATSAASWRRASTGRLRPVPILGASVSRGKEFNCLHSRSHSSKGTVAVPRRFAFRRYIPAGLSIVFASQRSINSMLYLRHLPSEKLTMTSPTNRNSAVVSNRTCGSLGFTRRIAR